MIGFWRTLFGPVYCCDSTINRALTNLTTRVESVTAQRPTTPTTTQPPAPQLAEELQRLEDQLAVSVQQLPEGVRQTFNSLKQALDNIQSALSEGRAINPQDLQTFRQQALRLGQLQGGGTTQAAPTQIRPPQAPATLFEQQMAQIQDPHTSIATLQQLVTDAPRYEVVNAATEALVQRARTSQNLQDLEQLSRPLVWQGVPGQRISSVQQAVVQNPHTPLAVLLALASENKQDLHTQDVVNAAINALIERAGYSQNPRDLEQLSRFFAWPDERIPALQHAVAENPYTPLAVLQAIANDPKNAQEVRAYAQLVLTQRGGQG